MFGIFKSKKKAFLKEYLENLATIAFPNGDSQKAQEASALHQVLRDKLSQEQAHSLLVWTKTLLTVSKDPSPEPITDGIFRHEEGRLTRDDANLVYRHITGYRDPLFSGGSGLYPDDPVTINCSISTVGIWAENLWLKEHFGQEGDGWHLKSRLHGYWDDGSAFETYEVQLEDGREVSVHFDISQWYMKN